MSLAHHLPRRAMGARYFSVLLLYALLSADCRPHSRKIWFQFVFSIVRIKVSDCYNGNSGPGSDGGIRSIGSIPTNTAAEVHGGHVCSYVQVRLGGQFPSPHAARIARRSLAAVRLVCPHRYVLFQHSDSFNSISKRCLERCRPLDVFNPTKYLDWVDAFCHASSWNVSRADEEG